MVVCEATVNIPVWSQCTCVVFVLCICGLLCVCECFLFYNGCILCVQYVWLCTVCKCVCCVVIYAHEFRVCTGLCGDSCLELLRLSELEHIRDELLIQLYHSKEAYVDQNTVRREDRGLVAHHSSVILFLSLCSHCIDTLKD